MSITLSELLRSVPAKTEERVEAARRRANTPIRSILRDRTRLALTFESDGKRQARQVSVHVQPGMPRHAENLEFDDDIHVLLKLARIRRLLEAGAAQWSEYQEANRKLAFSESIDLFPLQDRLFDGHEQRFRKLLEILESRDPLEKFRRFDRDILGLYTFRTGDAGGLFRSGENRRETGEVHLYWGIIGLVAELLGVAVEDLTIVVLTHELAHAYTHQGFDIDGAQWSSDSFGSAHKSVIEGLAQYFTHLCLEAKQDRFPEAFRVFEKLREKQHECYSAHVEWVSSFSPEIVRRAMLEARRSGKEVTGEMFQQLLCDGQKALTSGVLHGWR